MRCRNLLLRCSEFFDPDQRIKESSLASSTHRIAHATPSNRADKCGRHSLETQQYPGPALTFAGAAQQTLAK
jgi:hypothetical protein